MAIHLAFGIYDPRLLHEIGGAGSLVFLVLTLLTGFFRLVVRSSARKLARKDYLSVIKLSSILLTASVALAILWAATRYPGTDEETAAGAAESQAADRPLFYVGNMNSSNSNVGLSPAVNSNVNSSPTINSNINTNNIVNSNVNSPTNVLKQQNTYQQQNNTFIQRGGGPAPQSPPQASAPAPGAASASPAPSRPRAQPPAPVPSMTKRTDPDLARLVRQLEDLRRRGLREADPDAVYASSREVLKAFDEWREECLFVLKRIDRILTERYGEVSNSYGEFSYRVTIPPFASHTSDPVTSCKSLFFTFANGLTVYAPSLS
jgi:hypothetical protein